MKASVDRSSSRHVKRRPYLLFSFLPCLVTNGQKQSMPQKVKGGDSSVRSAGRSAVFGVVYMYVSQRHMNDATTLLISGIQYPSDLF